MEEVKLKKIVEWCDGKISEKRFNSCTVKGISTDTRKIKKGEIFVALKGEKYDGHQFIEQAYKKGSIGAIVSKKPSFYPSNFFYIEVKDTLEALGKIARGYRLLINPYVIGITGSDGKTTTKELITRCLGTKYKVGMSIGNYNNQVGVPLSILSFSKIDIGVVEMGMNKKGEIDYLSSIAIPDACVITNIGRAHIGFFKNTGEIAECKSEIFNNLKGEKFCLLNRDDRFFQFLKKRASKNLKSFGKSRRADVRGMIKTEGDDFFTFTVEGFNAVFKVNFWNTAMIYPLLSAIAFSEKFGVPLSEIKQVFESFQAIEGRGKIYKIDGITLIDESYNSNPNSLKNALLCFSGKNFKRKIAVIGDMAELGRFSTFYHNYIGKLIEKLDVDFVITLGNKSKTISEMNNGRHFSDIEELNLFLKEKLKKGDGILVKGSNFLGMYRIVEFLKQAL